MSDAQTLDSTVSKTLSTTASPLGPTLLVDGLKPAFAPPTIEAPEKPLSYLRLLRAATRNPIEMWPAEIFEKPFVTRNWVGNQKVHFIASPELLKLVMLDHHANFPQGFIQRRLLKPVMGEGLLTSQGEVWKRQRRATSPAFRIDNLRSMVPTMWRAGELAADDLCRNIEGSNNGNAPIDVHPVMTMATLEVIIDLLLGGDDSGMRRADVAHTVSTYRDTLGKVDLFLMLGVPKWVPRPWMNKGRKAVENMRVSAEKVIINRRNKPKNENDAPPDLLDLMLSARDPETGEGLSDIELRDNIMTFISAGHETTALALTWALYLIANDREVQTRLYNEVVSICGDGDVCSENIEALTYCLQVVREAMRLFPPVPVRSNQAVEDITLGDLDVKQNDHIVCLMYALHRHKALWKNPSEFNPENFSKEAIEGRHRFQYIPFGGGPRICIAMRMAELEAVAILAAMVRRLEFLPNPDHIPLPQLKITASPIGGMPLNVRKR